MSTIQRRRRRVGSGRHGLSAFRVFLVILITLSVLAAVTGGAVAAAAYSYYTKELPSPDKLQNREVFRSTKILDRNGRLLYELFDPQAGKRTYAKLSEISPYVLQATVAIEDDTFWDNQGISPRGILRAAWANFRGEEIQGGSTITQQLIKMVLIGDEVTLDRKIREAILAYRVNQQYTKEQILEWYVNEIFYGNVAYGIEAAAESYFGKQASELTLAESAMLVGIPNGPALYSPMIDPAAARKRQKLVLDSMADQGFISAAQAEAAAREPLDYQPMRYGMEAPHFVMYVRALLEQKYGPKLLYTGGLTVRTTIDLDMQHAAERIARQQIEKLKKDNIHNAALVAIRPGTGEILTMLGSVDYFDRTISGQVNIATSERQPGSAFKPITYSAAFMKGWSPATVILDDYTVFRDRQGVPYTPKNVDNKWHGPVSVRKAIGNSMNVPAVKALQFVGMKDALALAHQMGITSLQNEANYDLSLTLGGGEVKLLDMTFAYGVFANSGVMNGQPVQANAQKPGYRNVEPVSILSVEDANGKILEEFQGPQQSQVLSPQVAYLMNTVLTDNNARLPLFAPNGPLKLSRPAGAKTGTTDNNRDLWTMGYTPDLVTGVWVGNSDNQEIGQVLGSMAAGPIWHDFMEEVLAGTPATGWDAPGGVERVEVSAISGLKANKYCPDKVTDWFVKGTAPTKECDIHRMVVVDKNTGQPATPDTKPEDREEKVIEVYPQEWASWARAAGKADAIPTPAPQSTAAPAQPVENRDGNSLASITSPATGGIVRNEVEIKGSATGKAFASFKIEFGQGLAPTEWKAIGSPHNSPVDNGVLERWDTKGLGGIYKIRITLTEQVVPAATPAVAPTAQTGVPQPTAAPAPTAAPPRVKILELPVIVDNTAPAVTLTFPANEAEFKQKEMERITFTAQASDNHRLAQTEFFVDDRPVGSSTAVPATVEWTVSPGTHLVRAVAKDAAGNETRSSDVRITIKP